MMGRLVVVLFGGWLLALPVHAADQKEPLKLRGIKGKDDRHLVERVEPPWSAIGRVNRRTGGFCTGTLIAPDKVLTAAHCLWNPRTRNWLPPVSLHFVSGYRQGDFIAHARIAKFRVSPGYRPGRAVRDNLPHDWAILTLRRKIAALVGTIPVGEIGTNTKISQAGYSKDKPHILTLNRTCNVIKHDPVQQLISHDCDATMGDSGAPILQLKNNRLELIGIHIATAGKSGATRGIAKMNSAATNWQ